MRINRNRGDNDGVEVSMSPLIDCVFLLLIFFLVTTMMKKTERRIPIKQPDSRLSLSDKAQSGAHYIGIMQDGSLNRPSEKQDGFGRKTYVAIPDLPAYLKQLANKKGAKDQPLIIQAYKDLDCQKVIKIFDICTIQGFKNVTTSLEADNFQSIYVAKKDETKK